MKPPNQPGPVSPMKPAAVARFRALATAVLVCYWLAMFGGTHWPNFTLRGYPQDTDKVLHVSAYAGLAFLIALRLQLKRLGATAEPLRLGSVSVRDGLWILAFIVGCSIFDEVTQIPVGRTCDPFDAFADWAGGFFGLGAFAMLRRTLRRLSGE